MYRGWGTLTLMKLIKVQASIGPAWGPLLETPKAATYASGGGPV